MGTEVVEEEQEEQAEKGLKLNPGSETQMLRNYMKHHYP